MTEDEMVGWHHRLDGHEFEQVSGVGDGQGSLTYCSPWGHEELDTTERLNQTDCQRLRIPVGMSSENLAFIEFTTFSVSMKVHSCLCHL